MVISDVVIADVVIADIVVTDVVIADTVATHSSSSTCRRAAAILALELRQEILPREAITPLTCYSVTIDESGGVLGISFTPGQCLPCTCFAPVVLPL